MVILPILTLALFCIIQLQPLRHEGTKEIATEKAENTEKKCIGEGYARKQTDVRQDGRDREFRRFGALGID